MPIIHDLATNTQASTFSSWILASALLVSVPADVGAAPAEKQPVIKPAGTSASSSFHSAQIWAASEQVSLYTALREAFENLAAAQVELDPDMQRALYQNLWQLYD
jgi:hypothetical protein